MTASIEDIYVDAILVTLCALIFLCFCSGNRRHKVRVRKHTCSGSERGKAKNWPLPAAKRDVAAPVHAAVAKPEEPAIEQTPGVEREQNGTVQVQKVIPRFNRLASIIDSIDTQNLSISELGRVVHLDRVYAKLNSIHDVRTLLHRAGLQDNMLLVFGIDFTISNLHSGSQTFGGQSLHALKEGRPNPYQSVIRIIGEALEGACTGGIYAFGFGDLSSRDTSVVPILEGRADSYREVLAAYEAAIPYVTLSGPTSYSPIIRRSSELLEARPGTFCTTVIITDGCPTSERENILAMREAAHLPMSTIIIGVGDGPWAAMEHFVGSLPADSHCSFTDFHAQWSKVSVYDCAEAAFALYLTMKLPENQQCIHHLHHS